MGGRDVEPGEMILNRMNIPTFPYPDTAARVFDYMANYAENLRLLYETPMPASEGKDSPIDRRLAARIIKTARDSGRTLLTEFESKQLLASYGIPTVETRIAASEAEAVKQAEAIGYPVVVKLHSETITHKTDVDGVQLDLKDRKAVQAAYQAIAAAVKAKAGAEHFLGVTVQPMANLEGYELILGSSVDPQFGPVLLFGLGGQLVEVFKDRALGIPPLTTTLARRMMEHTRIYTALKGVRGRQPVDLAALERLLVRFGQLIVEQRWIKELDINPLLASPEHLLALDARVVIYGPDTTEEQLPKLAIRPFPAQYVTTWVTKKKRRITIRPILPEDEPLLVKFHESLSDKTVYMRYLQPMQLTERLVHERLARICHSDYDREITLVAVDKDQQGGDVVMGVGRLSKLHGVNDARLSLLVADPFQGTGIGGQLVNQMVAVARGEHLQRLTATLTPDNQIMQHIFQKLGFTLEPTSDGKLQVATLDLARPV
jgi:acetyltransferase